MASESVNVRTVIIGVVVVVVVIKVDVVVVVVVLVVAAAAAAAAAAVSVVVMAAVEASVYHWHPGACTVEHYFDNGLGVRIITPATVLFLPVPLRAAATYLWCREASAAAPCFRALRIAAST